MRKSCRPASIDRAVPRFVEPDTEEDLLRLFLENGWTDGLPVVLPTEERVRQCSRARATGLTRLSDRMRPTETQEAWEYTVEKVAVNAVMAGAEPAYSR